MTTGVPADGALEERDVRARAGSGEPVEYEVAEGEANPFSHTPQPMGTTITHDDPAHLPGASPTRDGGNGDADLERV